MRLITVTTDTPVLMFITLYLFPTKIFHLFQTPLETKFYLEKGDPVV